MAPIHLGTRSAARETTVSSEPQPTYAEVIAMLGAADKEVNTKYARIPKLRDELKAQYADSIGQCELAERDPLTLLRTRLRLERLVFDAYNKHRLGDDPTSTEEIEEDLESFPFRMAVVEGSFWTLTEDIEPIYQRVNHDRHNAADTDFVPATPQTKKSSSKRIAPSTAPSTRNKTGRTVENYDKLEDAPRPNLSFPNAKITIPEMAAFVPNAIKSWDVIDRVCGSGLAQLIYSIMMNHYREMARGQITANSTYRMFKGPISKRAKVETDHKPSWENWTPGIADQYRDDSTFDPSSVSVAGFRTPADGKNRTEHAPIPLKNLALGVKVFPSGNDALDLTRVVQYAVDHLDEDLMYPTDYDYVLAKLGGPATVTFAHTDAAVVARWTTAQQKNGRMTKNTHRKRDRKGRLQKVDSDEEDVDFDNMDETESEPEFDDNDETESEDDADERKKAHKRKCGAFDDSDDSNDIDTPSRKSSSKRTKRTPKPRASRIGGKQSISRPSRLHQEITPSDGDSDSDGDGYAGLKSRKKNAKKLLGLEVRRSGRATKFTQSFDMTDDFVDDVEEGFEPEDKELCDVISRYGFKPVKK